MVFNSLTFFVFFAIVLALHSLPLAWATRKRNLLIASYVFYAAWNPPFVVLLWLSTVVDWVAAKRLVDAHGTFQRRAWMLLSVGANLGVLGYFKYGNFLLSNFQSVLALMGVNYSSPASNILLPVGISFYTFATMSYTLDVYLGRAKPTPSFLDFSLFVTFFPHLVAGPIMRPSELVPQFVEPKRASANQLRFGLLLITLGLFQKVVLADGILAPPAELVFDGNKAPGMLDAWVSTLAFSGQIFCDFAGYSTTAIGVAMCLGFALPDNFRFPYAAIGFSDFWRRWHITLSAYLRDYVYIPLGGNRHGTFCTYAGLMVTMLLGGLWHGASWTFVAWGALHGIFLAAERFIRTYFSNARVRPWTLAAGFILTFVLINITWVLFRAKTFSIAQKILTGMFGLATLPTPVLPAVQLVEVLAVVTVLVSTHVLMRNRTLEDVLSRTSSSTIAIIWALMAFALMIEQGSGNAFIYFQF